LETRDAGTRWPVLDAFQGAVMYIGLGTLLLVIILIIILT
jgi:hypothetical protein